MHTCTKCERPELPNRSLQCGLSDCPYQEELIRQTRRIREQEKEAIIRDQKPEPYEKAIKMLDEMIEKIREIKKSI